MLQELVRERAVVQKASWSRSWMCQCCGLWKKSRGLLLVTSSAFFEQATARMDVQAASESADSFVLCGDLFGQAMEPGTCCSRPILPHKTG